MLLDLIETRGDKGKRFAAAKDSGFSTSRAVCDLIEIGRLLTDAKLLAGRGN